MAPGLRSGALVFYSGANQTGTVLAKVPLYGTGTGPQVAYYPGTAIAIDPTVNSKQLKYPLAVAVDGAGDLYIADYSNNRVVKVPAGGGAATSIDPSVAGAGLNGPQGVAVDGAGDLYISDSGNNRIVEVAIDGTLTAIHPAVNGMGFNDPIGIAVDGAGNLFVADQYNNRVVEVPSGGGAPVAIDPTVNGKSLFYPTAVAVDGAGDLFIADYQNSRVVEVPPGGGTPTAIAPAPNGQALDGVVGVAVDAAGDLYISNFFSSQIVEVPANGSAPTAIDTFVNGSSVFGPQNIAVDAVGNLFIADFESWRIVEVQHSVPPTFSFPTNTLVGSTDTADGPQTVTIFNVGNGALVFSAPSGSSPLYPPGFPENTGDSNLCSRADSYSPAFSCDISADFMPVSGGTNSSSIMLFDNASNQGGGLQNIAANGTGTTELAALTAPPPYSMLSTSAVFTWSAGAGVSNYWLTVGTATSGPNATNIYAGAPTTLLSATVNGIPTLGQLVYATLSSEIGGVWQAANVYTFVESIPVTSLSATSISFGNQAVGTQSASQSVTLTNTGSATLAIGSIGVTGANASSFVFGNSCGSSLAAGASCTIHGHFAPTATGPLTAAITIADSALNSPQTITLSGLGYNPTTVSLSATSLPFGNLEVGGTSGSQSVTLTNTGSATLFINSISTTGANASSFAFGNSCGSSLAAGANCTIHGHFAPTVAGIMTAAITIADTAGSTPQSIALSGIGFSPTTVSLSAASLPFGDEQVGAQSGTQSVTLTNTGSATLFITGFSVTGANASAFVFGNSCGSSVAAGASCTIHGHFAPTATGALTAAISIADTASGSPQTIALSGLGYTPTTVSLSAASLSFGDEQIGVASASQSVTLTNTGSATLFINSISLTGANAASFVFGNSCGTSLAAGANCAIHGHFAPTVSGSQTAVITITDTAAGSPQTVALSGATFAPTTVSLSAASITFSSEAVGATSASQSVTLTNTGSSTLLITGMTVTGPNASSFIFGNTCGTTLAAGANCSIHGHFTPTVAGALTATITLNDTATGSPQTIALSGTGSGGT
ncbi:MAG: choice-of-anchor D domain-containing protein [Terracidiphilus sp.]|jgi:sugar lactone lactonase YvrE